MFEVQSALCNGEEQEEAGGDFSHNIFEGLRTN